MYYPLKDPTIQQSEIAQERINWERKLESAKTFANLGVGAFGGSVLAFLAGVGVRSMGFGSWL